MRIAFTGTHITGKTTLLEDFSSFMSSNMNKHPLENKSFGYISGIARNLIMRGYPLNKDGNIDSYVNYINDQLEAEKNMFEYDIFISDRTLLSPTAYSLVNRDLPRPFIPDYFINMMKNVWMLEKERYDIYIYFPIEFNFLNENDNIHPNDEEYRRKIDVTIHRLLEENNVNHIHMTGTREERFNRLIEILTQ